MPRSVRFLIAAAVVLLAAAAGFQVASALGPERLRQEVEAWLARSTRAEAQIASLRLVVGFPIRLEGTGLRLYDGALTVERASARIDVVSLLLGSPRLTRLRLDGAHLRARLSPEGVWSPPIFRASESDVEEPALAPLRAIEGATRFLLTAPLLADTLVVRRSHIKLVYPDPSGSGTPATLALESVNGRLLHSRLFGDARLFLRVRLEQDGKERGRLEWNGTRDEAGAMQLTMAAIGVDLTTLSSFVRGARPGASLAGTLDGVADFSTAEPGVGRLELDLAARDVETSPVSSSGGSPVAPLTVPSLLLRMRVDVAPDRVVLSDARIGIGALDFSLDARIERPLRDVAPATVNLALSELPMAPDTARKLASWLPVSARRRVDSLAERVRSGRLVRAELSGEAEVRRWRDLLEGRLEALPQGFRLGFELDDMEIEVDAANRLEHLSASVSFEHDTLEVQRATADLNGGPLPELQLSFRGASKLLAAPPEERSMTASARALVGLTPLFAFLRGEPKETSESAKPTRIVLDFDRLEHPALIWPMHDVRMQLELEPRSNGVRLEVEHCAWAGVSLDGMVDWTLQPEQRLAIDLTASETAASEAGTAPAATGPEALAAPGGAAPPSKGAGRPWMVGRFGMGAIDSPVWTQRDARGRFSAVGGELRLEGVGIGLDPVGELSGEVTLDLTVPDAVPYRARLALVGADLAHVIAQHGAQGELATGTLDVKGRLSGSLVPHLALLHDASGSLHLDCVDGAIQRSVPPVFALALASSSLNPFSRRDELHYDRASADFELDHGRLETDGLDIVGPDIRLFASGSLDLSKSPHAVDAEVALFLFRQVDRALELIPIVNVLLLGENQNLLAAYFQLTGTWEKPVATAKPLRTLSEGPGDVLTKGIPRVVKRGLTAIGDWFRQGGGEQDQEQAAPAPPKPPPAAEHAAP